MHELFEKQVSDNKSILCILHTHFCTFSNINYYAVIGDIDSASSPVGFMYPSTVRTSGVTNITLVEALPSEYKITRVAFILATTNCRSAQSVLLLSPLTRVSDDTLVVGVAPLASQATATPYNLCVAAVNMFSNWVIMNAAARLRVESNLTAFNATLQSPHSIATGGKPVMARITGIGLNQVAGIGAVPVSSNVDTHACERFESTSYVLHADIILTHVPSSALIHPPPPLFISGPLIRTPPMTSKSKCQ